MGASGENREFCRVDKSTPVRCRKLEKLSENRYAKLGHISAEATNFGGGGLLLKVGENFAVGDYLLLEIALPSEKIPVKALGQVMRFLEKKENDLNKYFIAVKYLVIDESERDRLMKSIFSETVKKKIMDGM